MQFLHEILDLSSVKYPEQVSIIEENKNIINYKELSQKVEQLFSVFITNNILQNTRIAFYCEKSIDCVVSFLACSKANLIYVPISLLNPPHRASTIIKQAISEYVCVDKSNILIQDYLTENFTIYSKLEYGQLVFYKIRESNSKDSEYDDLAFILFTSGSTGNPKGVSISHKAALSFITWSAETFCLNTDDKILSIAPFNFDLSVFDIYASILSGASLYIYPDQTIKNPQLISSIIAEKKITSIYSTPTFFNTWMEYGKLNKYDLSSINKLLFAGELFHTDRVKKLRSIFNNAQIYNLYGPTETNVCTYYEVPKNLENFSEYYFPIGKDCTYAKTMLIDNKNNHINEPYKDGEILVSGQSLFTNYWNEPLKSKESYIYIEDIKYYKTGDIAFYNEQMELVYKNRLDNMIKKNGYRIELQEIEISMMKIDVIQQAVCLFFADKNEIHCFYEVVDGESIDVTNIKSICLDMIPAYMIPDKFVYLSSIPTTISGKVDKNALIQQL